MLHTATVSWCYHCMFRFKLLECCEIGLPPEGVRAFHTHFFMEHRSDPGSGLPTANATGSAPEVLAHGTCNSMHAPHWTSVLSLEQSEHLCMVVVSVVCMADSSSAKGWPASASMHACLSGTEHSIQAQRLGQAHDHAPRAAP